MCRTGFFREMLYLRRSLTRITSNAVSHSPASPICISSTSFADDDNDPTVNSNGSDRSLLKQFSRASTDKQINIRSEERGHQDDKYQKWVEVELFERPRQEGDVKKKHGKSSKKHRRLSFSLLRSSFLTSLLHHAHSEEGTLQHSIVIA